MSLGKVLGFPIFGILFKTILVTTNKKEWVENRQTDGHQL